eukprot:m.6919 g.6919  ORF g.6919 m.6919 type:complete len:504 (-) comp4895_c0_seq1:43-1554(-)
MERTEAWTLALTTTRTGRQSSSSASAILVVQMAAAKHSLEEVEDKPLPPKARKAEDEERSRHCPYLDTINRAILDFDFEKLCSISLSNQNVYACLVCGKYFQGRGKGTHAYTHSLQMFHHVFLNLETLKFYCLPDNYEVIDSSLEDIKFVLKPSFSGEAVKTLDASNKLSLSLDGTQYLPGAVGLNNIKANDYVNAVVQCLAHVPPLRDFFLREENYAFTKDPLVVTLGELMRKLWNPRAFKTHVSPHELLQAVTSASGRRFKIIQQSDPAEFLTWLLNALHPRLRRGKRSIISDTFQGHMDITTCKLPPISDTAQLQAIDPNDEQYKPVVQDSPFYCLTLDLPPAPLFQDDTHLIPQVPLFELLNKFDGVTEKEYKETFMKKKFQLTALPDYLIVVVKRFTKNYFFKEKNSTIVNFPIRGIDFKDYLKEVPEAMAGAYKYDLLANLAQDSVPGTQLFSYRTHINHKGSKHWYDIQDLTVTETLPQMIPLSESYIQIWERQKE